MEHNYNYPECCFDVEYENECEINSDNKESESKEKSESFIAKVLKDYARTCKPPNEHIDYLLKRFHEYDYTLPKSHKTFLQS